jgi:integrase
MGANWIGKWAGGRVRQVGERKVWVLERLRRVITLTATSEPEAMAELALFTRDPNAYRSKREADSAGDVTIDDVTLKPFMLECERRDLNIEYRTYVLKKYLTEWGTALNGKDLRRLPLREYMRLLDGWKTGRKHRIIALKAFTAWLRETGQLKASEDESMSIHVPPSRAAKSIKAKGYTMQQVERFYARVTTQYVRDLICLRAKTGMHHTEIDRIGHGNCVLRRVDDPSGIVGTVTFPHKSSRMHVLSLDAQSFAAAERLVAHGRSPAKRTVTNALDVAAKRLGVEALRPGELRHSFATWATTHGTLVRPHGAGVPLEQVAAVMGHVTPRTTKLFYEGAQVPVMIALPLKLQHPQDPVALTGTAASRSAS